MNAATETRNNIIYSQTMRAKTPMLTASALPTLPGYVFKLNHLLASADPDVDAICQVIRTDAGLTAQVLRLANLYRLESQELVCTVRGAIEAVGIQRLKMMVITCPLLDCAGDMERWGNLQSFWQHNFMTAALAEVIAKNVGYRRSEVAYTAALLRNIGELPLIVQSFQGGVLWPSTTDHRRAGEARSREVGRRLAIACKFAPELVEVCGGGDPALAWHDPLLVSIVQAASRFCVAAGLASGGAPRQLLGGDSLKATREALQVLPCPTSKQLFALQADLLSRFRQLIPALEFNLAGLLRGAAAESSTPAIVPVERTVEMAIA